MAEILPTSMELRTEQIAHAGRNLVERVACSLEQLGASLSQYDDALAEDAKAQLRILAVTCSDRADVAPRARFLAEQIGICYFARFAVDATSIARTLGAACEALERGIAEHESDRAAEAFIAEALECAADTRFAAHEFAGATCEIDGLLHAIGIRCKQTVDVAIPDRIRAHCRVAPLFHFFIHPQVGEGSFALTTLRLPGGHHVMPSAFVLPNGPLLGFAT